MTIQQLDEGWALKQRATEFGSWIVRDSLGDDKAAAFVVFEIAEGEQSLKHISIYPDMTKWPEYSQSATIHKMEFDVDRNALAFPKQNEVIRPVEVKKKTEIESAILDSLRPVAVNSH